MQLRQNANTHLLTYHMDYICLFHWNHCSITSGSLLYPIRANWMHALRSRDHWSGKWGGYWGFKGQAPHTCLMIDMLGKKWFLAWCFQVVAGLICSTWIEFGVGEKLIQDQPVWSLCDNRLLSWMNDKYSPWVHVFEHWVPAGSSVWGSLGGVALPLSYLKLSTF